jgi:hypothetical protein
MAVQLDRRQGDRRLTVMPGGRGKGPGMAIVLRAQLVEHHIDDQVDWSEVAKAARQIATFADSRQAKAWKRVKSWDPEPA